MRTLVALASLIFATQFASATTFSATHSYYTRLHFSEVAYGKKVIDVYAHIGVLTRNSSGRGGAYYWDDVQHLRMEKRGDHYERRALLGGSSSYEHHYAQGPIVQYWVYFEDGSHLKTKPVTIQVRRTESHSLDTAEGRADLEKAYQTETKRLNEEEIRETFGVEVRGSHVG